MLGDILSWYLMFIWDPPDMMRPPGLYYCLERLGVQTLVPKIVPEYFRWKRFLMFNWFPVLKDVLHISSRKSYQAIISWCQRNREYILAKLNILLGRLIDTKEVVVNLEIIYEIIQQISPPLPHSVININLASIIFIICKYISVDDLININICGFQCADRQTGQSTNYDLRPNK